MEWLQQNWIYLALLVGVILFMRVRGVGRFGARHSHSDHGHDQQAGSDASDEPGPATDPVSGRPVDPKSAVATVYQGRAFYFESRENRDRFEASPQKYAGPASGEPREQGHRHHGGGCC